MAFIGAAASLPIARAQQSMKVHRMTILYPSHPITELTEVSHFPYWRKFFQELRQNAQRRKGHFLSHRSSEGQSLVSLIEQGTCLS
jgi:hypothetical protein